MILDTDALEALRSTLAARGVTSLTDEDPTDAEYLWALVQDLTEARAELATVALDSYIDGLRAYAWWKDGVEYVGSCGRTLKEAIALAKTEG